MRDSRQANKHTLGLRHEQGGVTGAWRKDKAERPYGRHVEARSRGPARPPSDGCRRFGLRGGGDFGLGEDCTWTNSSSFIMAPLSSQKRFAPLVRQTHLAVATTDVLASRGS